MFNVFTKKKSILFLLNTIGLVIFGISSADAQETTKQSLLVVSCDTEKDCKHEVLRKFTFQDGNLISQKELATFPATKSHFGLGRSQVFDKRYIVSSFGEIFDLITNTYFNDKSGYFAGYENGQLFINTIKSLPVQRDITGYPTNSLEPTAAVRTYVFNLEKREYEYLAGPNFFSEVGLASPNLDKKIKHSDITKIVIMHRVKEGIKPHFEELKGKFKASCDSKCGGKVLSAPFVWIDNDRFLTQEQNGKLVIYDVTKASLRPLEPIEVSDNLINAPSMRADDEGNVYYVAGKIYKINPESGKHQEIEGFFIGKGFKVSGLGDIKQFMFNDKKIGAFITDYSKTTTGYLAAEFQDEPLLKSIPFFVSNLSVQTWTTLRSKPIGVRVWSTVSDKWTNIKIKFQPRIIGWISN